MQWDRCSLANSGVCRTELGYRITSSQLNHGTGQVKDCSMRALGERMGLSFDDVSSLAQTGEHLSCVHILRNLLFIDSYYSYNICTITHFI